MSVEQLTALTDALDGLLDLDPATLTDAELHDTVIALGRQTNRLQAAWCRLIRPWDVRQVWADNGSRAPGARLARECHLRKTAADHLVHEARDLDTMPATTAAFAAGDLGSDQVDLLAAANRDGRQGAFADDEAELVKHCTELWYPTAAQVVRYWCHRVDAHSGEDEAERVRQGRHCSISTAWRGEVKLDAVLDPIGGAIVEEELHRICERFRLQDERDGVTRTIQQRRADALVEMAMRSATAAEGGLRPRPLITVIVGEDRFRDLCELASGVVTTPGQLAPYLCDADYERIIYDPPARRAEASYRRSFTGAVRRIIEVVNRHCQHESGCDVRASRCDVDHIIPRSQGGVTCLCNGRLLCPTHNRHPDKRNPERRPSSSETDDDADGSPRPAAGS